MGRTAPRASRAAWVCVQAARSHVCTHALTCTRAHRQTEDQGYVQEPLAGGQRLCPAAPADPPWVSCPGCRWVPRALPEPLVPQARGNQTAGRSSTGTGEAPPPLGFKHLQQKRGKYKLAISDDLAEGRTSPFCGGGAGARG